MLNPPCFRVHSLFFVHTAQVQQHNAEAMELDIGCCAQSTSFLWFCVDGGFPPGDAEYVQGILVSMLLSMNGIDRSLELLFMRLFDTRKKTHVDI